MRLQNTEENGYQWLKQRKWPNYSSFFYFQGLQFFQRIIDSRSHEYLYIERMSNEENKTIS